MKLLLAAVLLAGTASNAQAETPRASSLLGTWELDVARMPFPPDKRPKSVTLTYREADGGKWQTVLDVVGGDGRPIHAEVAYALDGQAVSGSGYPGVDMVATQVPAPNVMVAAYYKENMPRTTRTYVVSPDGKVMTETVVWLNLNGKPEVTTSFFNRVK